MDIRTATAAALRYAGGKSTTRPSAAVAAIEGEIARLRDQIRAHRNALLRVRARDELAAGEGVTLRALSELLGITPGAISTKLWRRGQSGTLERRGRESIVPPDLAEQLIEEHFEWLSRQKEQE